MNAADWDALALTLKLAALSTAALLVITTPAAYWLASGRSRWRTVVEAAAALPLVLPPTVLGFYLLLWLAPDGALGKLSAHFGGPPLAFHFTGLVIGSVIYSLPFVLQPLRDAFASVDEKLLEAAATLGAGPWRRFWKVTFPLARPGYLTAVILGFAHTLGEFGVVLMIGGNIPGETRVMSIAIYEHVETLNYGKAHTLSAILLVLSFTLLLVVYGLGRRFGMMQGGRR